jgi:hypothetical protein
MLNKSAPYVGHGGVLGPDAVGQKVPRWLQGSSLQDDLSHLKQGCPGAQHRAQVYYLFTHKAGPQFAVGGESEPVAPETEVLTYCADETHRTPGARKPEVFGGAAPVFGETGLHISQGTQYPGHLGYRYELRPIRPPKRHKLNEAHIPATVYRQAAEFQDFIVIDTAHNHHIYLHWLQAHPLRPLQALQHLIQVIPAANLCKASRAQSVKAYIHAVQPGLLEAEGESGEEAAIGGKR